MKITYHEKDDILYMVFSKKRVVRDESINWSTHVGYTDSGIGEITILDAQKSGIYPIEVEHVVL